MELTRQAKQFHKNAHCKSLEYQKMADLKGWLRHCVLPAIALLPVVNAGCGSGLKEFPCETASGVVLCKGKPVREAQVYFTPKAKGKSAEVGKPGFSWTDEEGRFVLSTYGEGDGAVVGEHVVRVTTGSKFPCDCIGEETRDLMTVQIKEGEKNEFTIDLPPKTGSQKSAVNPFDDPEDTEPVSSTGK